MATEQEDSNEEEAGYPFPLAPDEQVRLFLCELTIKYGGDIKRIRDMYKFIKEATFKLKH